MKSTRHVLFLFVDGLGMGSADPAVNPIFSGCCPCLQNLLLTRAVGIDAGLGVPGLPQSATGQTALLTGENAAVRVGRHVEGFPGPKLKKLIIEKNIFRRLLAMGLKATFANAYYVDETASVENRRVKSVTTVATLDAFGLVRDRHYMDRNEAVFQDLVRDELRSRGYTGPAVTPVEAAQHLAAIAADHHFTLFEYFQTDRAGHAGDPSRVRQVLANFDAFLAELLARAEAGAFLLLLTSDHGNIEDSRTGSHTMNPVPFTVIGPDAEFFKDRVHSLTDVTPSILELLGNG